jgi:hypothetical protein
LTCCRSPLSNRLALATIWRNHSKIQNHHFVMLNSCIQWLFETTHKDVNAKRDFSQWGPEQQRVEGSRSGEEIRNSSLKSFCPFHPTSCHETRDVYRMFQLIFLFHVTMTIEPMVLEPTDRPPFHYQQEPLPGPLSSTADIRLMFNAVYPPCFSLPTKRLPMPVPNDEVLLFLQKDREQRASNNQCQP